LAAGDREAVDLGEVLGRANLDRRRAERREGRRVLSEVALQGEHAGLHRDYQPRSCSRVSSVSISRPCIGSPIPRLTFATTSGSWKCVVASTIARAMVAGSWDLKMPE